MGTSRLRIVRFKNELTLRIARMHGIWGSRHNLMTKWQPGDRVLAYVDLQLATLGTVLSEAFRSDEQLWPDDLYPWRVRIHYTELIPTFRRIDIDGPVRDLLWKSLGKRWAFRCIVLQEPLLGVDRELVAMVEIAASRPGRLAYPTHVNGTLPRLFGR